MNKVLDINKIGAVGEYKRASMMSEKMKIDDELYDKETALKNIFKEF